MRFALRHIGRFLLLMVAVSLVVFALVGMAPIDPVAANVGQAALGGMSEEKRAALQLYWGGDEPFPQRYLAWASGLLAGDMGTSLRFNAPVADVIAAARQMDRAGYRPWQPNRPDAVFSPDELSSQWYVRLASGELAGEKLTVPNAEAGESGWITAAMTRPELDKLLAGRDVLAVIRVLD